MQFFLYNYGKGQG